MLTQINECTLVKQCPSKLFTISINPQLQQNIKLNRIISRKIEKRLKNNEGVEKSPNTPKDKGLADGIMNLDTIPFKSYKKYQSSSSIPKSSKAKLSSYQIYKDQQKMMKQKHFCKLNYLKKKYIAQKINQNSLKKSQSFKKQTTSSIQSKISSKIMSVVSSFLSSEKKKKQDLPINNRNRIYIKTSQGRRQKINSESYFTKLKTKNLMMKYENMNKANGFKPIAQSIMPLPYRTVQAFTSPKKIYSQRSKSKPRVIFTSKNDCRPWSPLYKEIEPNFGIETFVQTKDKRILNK